MSWAFFQWPNVSQPINHSKSCDLFRNCSQKAPCSCFCAKTCPNCMYQVNFDYSIQTPLRNLWQSKKRQVTWTHKKVGVSCLFLFSRNLHSWSHLLPFYRQLRIHQKPSFTSDILGCEIFAQIWNHIALKKGLWLHANTRRGG